MTQPEAVYISRDGQVYFDLDAALMSGCDFVEYWREDVVDELISAEVGEPPSRLAVDSSDS